MIALRAQNATATVLVAVASAADTAAATSEWVDVRPYIGDVDIVQSVGALTGTVLGSIEDAEDIEGTEAAPFLPLQGAFTSVSSANDVQMRTVIPRQTRGFIRYAGTVGTGPALMMCLMIGQLK